MGTRSQRIVTLVTFGVLAAKDSGSVSDESGEGLF
jgi:hypothetical protein